MLLGLGRLRSLLFIVLFAVLSMAADVYYQTYDTGSSGMQITCHSCMSKRYEAIWSRVFVHIYNEPRIFTDDCNESPVRNARPIECSTRCIDIADPLVSSGYVVQHDHIRGCIDSLLTGNYQINESVTKLPYKFYDSKQQCFYAKPSELLVRRNKAAQIGGQEKFRFCVCSADFCNGGDASRGRRLCLPHCSSLFAAVLLLLLICRPLSSVT